MFVTIEVLEEPTTHTVMIEKLKRWIKSHGRHPHDEAKKKELLAVHPSGHGELIPHLSALRGRFHVGIQEAPKQKRGLALPQVISPSVLLLVATIARTFHRAGGLAMLNLLAVLVLLGVLAAVGRLTRRILKVQAFGKDICGNEDARLRYVFSLIPVLLVPFLQDGNWLAGYLNTEFDVLVESRI